MNSCFLNATALVVLFFSSLGCSQKASFTADESPAPPQQIQTQEESEDVVVQEDPDTPPPEPPAPEPKPQPEEKQELLEWKALYDARFNDQLNDGSWIITPARSGMRGLVISKKKYQIDNLTISFKFRMDRNGGIGDEGEPVVGADGINFAITPYDEAQMNPGEGGAIGFRGIGGFSVELDSYENGQNGDPDGNHIAIVQDVNGVVQHLVVSDEDIPILNDKLTRELTIVFEEGVISVKLDGNVVIDEYVLPNFQPFDGHLVFSSATGLGWNRHSVWDIFAKINE